jgi:hypothetical protein
MAAHQQGLAAAQASAAPQSDAEEGSTCDGAPLRPEEGPQLAQLVWIHFCDGLILHGGSGGAPQIWSIRPGSSKRGLVMWSGGSKPPQPTL